MQLGQRVGYLGCSFAIGVFSAFNNFTLALWLTGFTSSYILISLFGNTRSFEGAIISPLAGVLSDRTWLGWLGRRRPFILVGGLLSAILMAGTPDISRLALPPGLDWVAPEWRRLVMPLAAIFLFTLTFNVMDDIHKALLTDLTRDAECNFLSALSNIVNIASQVGLLALGYLIWTDGVPDSAFVLTGVLMAAGILLTVLGVREPTAAELAALHAADDPPPETGASLFSVIRASRGATVLFLVAFCYWTGVNAVFPLVSIYTRDMLGASTGEAQLLPGLLLLSTTVMSFPAAWLGTRYGKLRVIGVGFLIMLAAAVAGMLITTRLEGAILFLAAGIGNSAWIVLAIPLLADLVPRSHMGAAAGTLAASGSLAAPLASVVGGALADLYGPRAIFGVMAVMVVLAALLMPLIRLPESPEPAEDNDGTTLAG